MDTQVLRNSGERLLVTFTIDGIPTDADGAVTVTITADDGAAIATAAPAPHVVTGVYSYILAPQANLDHLTAVWSGEFSGTAQTVTTYVDIVGGYYVGLAELLAMKNMSTFTAAELIEARQWFETLAEDFCGQAFVPRYRRQRISGSGTRSLMLKPNLRVIRSVRDFSSGTVFTDFTESDLADIVVGTTGAAIRMGGWWPVGTLNLDIVYEHGWDTCPNDVRQAAKDAIRYHLLDAQQGKREYSTTTELGQVIRYSQPGPGRPTGYQDVDEVLNRRQLIGVA